jgi:GNAT superfamily N-acetyltransferase
MDASFLTRVVSRLEEQGLVAKSPSELDGRRLNLKLTGAGRAAFRRLDKRSNAQIDGLLQALTDGQRRTVAEAMTVISHLVRPFRRGERNVTVRGIEVGDTGWVVQRHGEIYLDEFGWDITFEALVAKIVADYHANYRASRENAWIAEVDGARAGCVFCCERDPDTAQLRILLVEPWARGLGLGSRLVDDCITFGRGAGYSKMMLWTNDVLVAARRIYETAGFVLVEEEEHHSFGHGLVGQNWELELELEPEEP